MVLRITSDTIQVHFQVLAYSLFVQLYVKIVQAQTVVLVSDSHNYL